MGRNRGRVLVPVEARPSLERLAQLHKERTRIEVQIAAEARNARAQSATWGHIGDALGTSPQAAQMRFGEAQ